MAINLGGLTSALGKIGKVGVSTLKDGKKLSNTIQTVSAMYSTSKALMNKNTGIKMKTTDQLNEQYNPSYQTTYQKSNVIVIVSCIAAIATTGIIVFYLFKKRR